MAEFISDYTGPMDNDYYVNASGIMGNYQSPNLSPQQEINENIIGIQEMGASVPEGRQFGSFIQTMQNMIRKGVSKVELATNMGGGHENVGAEAYGQDARRALRELSKANNVDIISIHSPSNIGNMSGYNPQERGFNDEHRKMQLEEVKKAIEFAADTGGGAVVVHTGEYQREMGEQEWAKEKDGSYRFLHYTEEPGRAVKYMVDDRNGKLMTEVRKNQIVREPKFKTAWDPVQKRERWIDKDGKFLDENNLDHLFQRVPVWDQGNTRFETSTLTWDDFEKRAEVWNRFYKKPGQREMTPEDMFIRSQMETRILQARGSSLFYGRDYDKYKQSRDELMKKKEEWQKFEDQLSPEQIEKLKRDDHSLRMYASEAGEFLDNEKVRPTELIQRRIDKLNLDMKHIHEASASADANADETQVTMEHIVPVENYAQKQTSRSYAEAGIYAMQTSHKNPHIKRDIYVAPENIFPEMGYGSHPDELIDLVKKARKEMVDLMTKKKIPDRYEIRDHDGNLKMVDNPYFNPTLSEDKAKQVAEKHIKATFDTQHLGMWWKHFQPKPGETPDQTKKRFDKWYVNQVEKMAKENIIGHIHAVDAMGAGHHHLPIGQGNIPVRKALELLKKKGYKGTMISEGYGEDATLGQGRQVMETWKGLGSSISTGYGAGMGAPMRWGDVHNSYFGHTRPPYFIFGAYSPSNDWQLWTQVPLE